MKYVVFFILGMLAFRNVVNLTMPRNTQPIPAISSEIKPKPKVKSDLVISGGKLRKAAPRPKTASLKNSAAQLMAACQNKTKIYRLTSSTATSLTPYACQCFTRAVKSSVDPKNQYDFVVASRAILIGEARSGKPDPEATKALHKALLSKSSLSHQQFAAKLTSVRATCGMTTLPHLK